MTTTPTTREQIEGIFKEQYLAPELHQGTIGKVFSLISTHYIPRERVEAVCKSHNLETEYENPDCGVIDHTPQWDGNYYTCRFCGKEFVLKDNISRALLEDNKE